MKIKKGFLKVICFKAFCLMFLPNSAFSSSFEDDFNDGMVLAQERINEKKYEEALTIVEKLSALVATDEDAGATEKAWVYDFQRYTLYELGRKEDAYAVCEDALADIGDQAYEWQYLKEFHVVRRTLRACLNMLAWAKMESATTIQDLGVAISRIESVFSIVAVTEDRTVVDEFRGTQARIYLKAVEFDERYRPRAFLALTEVSKLGASYVEEDAILQRALKSDAFKNYKLPQVYVENSIKTLPAAKSIPAAATAEHLQIINDCQNGVMQTCDDLYAISLRKTQLEAYGNSCGGRVRNNEIDCVTLAQERWSKKIPKGKRPPKDVTKNAANSCFQGDLGACDLLNEGAPAGTELAHYGYSCGGRFELVGASCGDLLQAEENE